MSEQTAREVIASALWEPEWFPDLDKARSAADEVLAALNAEGLEPRRMKHVGWLGGITDDDLLDYMPRGDAVADAMAIQEGFNPVFIPVGDLGDEG